MNALRARSFAGASTGSASRLLLEDQILINCSRLHLDEVQRDRVISASAHGEVNWELVYSAAVAHKIAPLVYQKLRSCESINNSIPAKVVHEFESVLRWNAFKNAIVRERMAELAAYFDSRSHDVLLLKHAALSVQIRELFDLTMSDDIDIVVRPKGEMRDRLDERYLWRIRPWMIADRFQKAARWNAHNTPDHTSDLIRKFEAERDPWRRFFHFELDSRIHHDIVWGGVIPIDFRMVWQDAIVAQVDGRPVYVPDVHDSIIMSAITVHRKPYIRLRNIAEIHELVEHREKLNWQAFVRKVCAYQCNYLVYSALHATRALLGSHLPESDLEALRPGALRGRAITFINRHASPSAICRSHTPGERSRIPRRGHRDLARRFLALNGRQLMRFLWFRIVLERILGVLKR